MNEESLKLSDLNQFVSCCYEGREVYEVKDAQYGSNYKTTGVVGVASDLINCLGRLKQLVIKSSDHGESEKEAILNVALDAHNYANLLKMVVLANNWTGVEDEENTEKL